MTNNEKIDLWDALKMAHAEEMVWFTKEELGYLLDLLDNDILKPIVRD